MVVYAGICNVLTKYQGICDGGYETLAVMCGTIFGAVSVYKGIFGAVYEMFIVSFGDEKVCEGKYIMITSDRKESKDTFCEDVCERIQFT